MHGKKGLGNSTRYGAYLIIKGKAKVKLFSMGHFICILLCESL